MTRNEIIERIAAERTEEHCCIKAWGEDPKLIDYELVDPFIEKLPPVPAYSDFVLLDMEELWKVLIDLDPDKLTRVYKCGKEVIEWVWTDSAGANKINNYPFSAEGIMMIMNEEFFS